LFLEANFCLSKANARVLEIEAELDSLKQRFAETDEERRKLAVLVQEERSANAESQLGMAQLMGEFSSSVSAGEEAAEILNSIEDLTAAAEGRLSDLAPCIGRILVKAAAVQTAQQTSTKSKESEQLRFVELEMELDQRSKAAHNAVEESARLTAVLESLELEKLDLEAKVMITCPLNGSVNILNTFKPLLHRFGS
jgi:chromosome segregation ATPase